MNSRNKKETVKGLLKPGNSLSERTIKGGLWVFSLRIVNRLFQLARTIVLARLLSPNDFGLFGIALLALSALDTFSQTGFRQALIQKKEDIKPYLDTVWTVGIIRGFLIAAILFFAAPYVAIFFKSPPAEPILKIIGLAIILQSLTNIAVIYFEKELEFHKYFTYQFVGTILDVTVAISAAFLLRSVWALVFGILAGNFTRFIVSYWIHQYRPQLKFDMEKVKNLFSFGKWIFGLSIITFLFNHGDDVFLGKVLGVTILGFYQMAYRIGQVPATEFAKVTSRVTFPVYSKLQDNFSKLKEAFLKTLNITAIFMIPLAGGIFILADEFTKIFLGEKWIPIIPVLKILVLAGVFRALVTTGGALFQGKGIPNVDYRMNFVRLFIMVITIYPLTLFFGMSGTALAVALGNFGCIPIWLIETAKIIQRPFKDYFKIILLPFLATIIMCSVILSFLKLIMSINLSIFIFIVMFAVIIYFASMHLLEKILNIRILNDLKSVIQSLREKQT